MSLWSSSRGKTQLCRARMRPSLPKIWPPTSCRATSQTLSCPLPPPPRSLRSTPGTLPPPGRICSNLSWTRPLPSTRCCTACARPVPPRTRTVRTGAAGGERSVLGSRRLPDPATPPLPGVRRPALPARPPLHHLLMKNGKERLCQRSAFP